MNELLDDLEYIKFSLCEECALELMTSVDWLIERANGEGKRRRDGLMDEQIRNGWFRLASAILHEQLEPMFDSLSSREQEVISMRFGLTGEKRATLERVAEQYQLTRERVRQIEGRALSKLRAKVISVDFLENEEE